MESLQPLIKRKFFDLAPVKKINDFNPTTKFRISVASYIILVAIFLSALLSNYLNGRDAKYVSFKKANGICEEVQKKVSQSFQVTYDGYYSGQLGYKFFRSMFDLSLIDFSGELSDYSKMMASLNDNYFNKYGTIMITSSYEYNMLVWLASEYRYKDKGIVSLSGTTSSLYDTSSETGESELILMSTKNPDTVEDQICIKGDFVLDSSSSTFTTYIDNTDINTRCQDLHIDYQSNYVYTDFILELDTVIPILSYNYGILSKSSLDKQTDYYSYSKYPDSKLILLNDEDKQSIAYIEGGSKHSNNHIYMLPFFGHNDDGANCNCTNFHEDDRLMCEYPDYIIGALLFNNTDDIKAIYDRYKNDLLPSDSRTIGQILNEDIIKYLNFIHYKYPYYRIDVPASQNKLNEICDGKCDVISLRYMKDVDISSDNIITQFTKHGYRVTNFVCSNSIAISSVNYNNIKTPPVSLIEQYYKCEKPDWLVFLNAAGVAISIIAIVPFLFALCIKPSLYGSLMLYGHDPKEVLEEEFTEDQRQDVIHKLAIQLLKYEKGIGHENIIAHILHPFEPNKFINLQYCDIRHTETIEMDLRDEGGEDSKVDDINDTHNKV